MNQFSDPATGKSVNMGPGHPLMVAEISGNHDGNYERAIGLIDVARWCGFDAVKFQLFDPGDLAMPAPRSRFRGEHSVAWRGASVPLHDLYTTTRTPRDWFPGLFSYARSLGLIPLSSVFSYGGIDFLMSECYPAALKVASAEGRWGGLVANCAKTGLPVMVSDGDRLGAEWEDMPYGAIPMRCVPRYPAMPHEYAFGDIQPLGHWGVSDHTGELDDTVSIVAAALGAEVIEFHIADNGPVTQDHEFSLTPAAAQRRVWAARTAARMAYDMPWAFDISFARRWVAVTDIEEGDVLGPANTALYRCKEGLPADTEVWGGVATVPMCAGQPITLDVAEW